MKVKMNKKIAIVLAVLILTLSIGSVAFAAGSYKNLKAWYNNIKIFKNGQQVQLDFEPFIIDGYTYVPLRAVGELFNKDFVWDGVNYTIDIKDRPDTNLNALMTQVVNQQVTISTLEAKIKSLEAELAKTPTVTNLSDLEKQLNKDYGTYQKVDFEIDLYESKGNIEVRIYIDTRYDGTAWNKISSTNRKSFVQDIVDDIRYKYKDAKISGYIEDIDKGRELYSISVSTKGTVTLTTKSSGGSSGDSDNLYDLENDLYWKFAREDYGIMDFGAYGDRYELDLYVYVDDYVWDRLSDVSKTTIKNEITNYIRNNYYYNVDIYGEIIDYYDDYYIERL